MAGLPFYLLDVFAERRHEGNQLMVIVDADGALDTAACLAITREVNFAETAFLCGPAEAEEAKSDEAKIGHGASSGLPLPLWEERVRIFTPEYEVPFAGHPTLGLAHVAALRGLARPVVGGFVNAPGAAATAPLLETTVEEEAAAAAAATATAAAAFTDPGLAPPPSGRDASLLPRREGIVLVARGGRVAVNWSPVEAGGDGVWWMDQPPPVFLPSLPLAAFVAHLVPASVAGLVDHAMLERSGSGEDERLNDGGCNDGDGGCDDGNGGGSGGGGCLLVPEVSTGLPYLLVPVRGPAALAAVRMVSGSRNGGGRGGDGSGGGGVGGGGGEKEEEEEEEEHVKGEVGDMGGLRAVGRDAGKHPLGLNSSVYFYHFEEDQDSDQDKGKEEGEGAYHAAGGYKECSGEEPTVPSPPPVRAAAVAAAAARARLCARMFCFERGLWVEDAATGSAAGCLAALLAKTGRRQPGTGESRWALPATITQGVAMGRPSTLRIDAKASAATATKVTAAAAASTAAVADTAPAAAAAMAHAGGGRPSGTLEDAPCTWTARVGGRVVPIAQGTWFVDPR